MKEMICIVCPRGCRLTMDEHGEIHGNFCRRGAIYGKQEATAPMRILTTTVALYSESDICRLPVMTAHEIPKEKMDAVIAALKDVKVKAPIRMRQVIVPNILDLGVDIVATKEVLK